MPAKFSVINTLDRMLNRFKLLKIKGFKYIRFNGSRSYYIFLIIFIFSKWAIDQYKLLSIFQRLENVEPLNPWTVTRLNHDIV
jgi:hypothetical protein